MQYQKPILVQQQQLKLSPQLYQSIQLMTLPIQDLSTRISEEIEKNPALEIVGENNNISLEDYNKKDSPVAEDYSGDYDYEPTFSETGMAESVVAKDGKSRKEQDLSGEAFNFEDNYSYSSSYTGTSSYTGDDDDSKRKFLEGAVSRAETLKDHLLWQLRVSPLQGDEYELGELLIENLDQNGFHIEPPEKLVKPDRLDDLLEVMQYIQRFDPVGICTKDYMESLKVQAEQDLFEPKLVVALIEEYLPMLEKGEFKKIAKKLKVKENDVLDGFEYIKGLIPFPGRLFSSVEPTYVVPDLMVKMKDGEFILVLNDEEIPILGINDYFSDVVDGKEEKVEKNVKQYVSNQVKDAQWFIRSIEQRNSTLLKTAKTVVEYQRDFFLKGPKALKPLTRKDIAEQIDVHESTVARIATEKYIQTEWGIFELRYFFTNSISGSGSSGSNFSKEGVKQVVKEIIEGYTGKRKLSDQKISDMLKERGISLARRTVAKYRKELDIDSSYDRR